jgi:phosphoribosylglycinamide formyltransferase-1
MSVPQRLVVLISGRGSNLGALIAAQQAGMLAGEIVGVISNRKDAAGLDLARTAGIPSKVVLAKPQEPREQYDLRLDQAISEFAPDWIALAGFMRILSAEFVLRHQGHLINIHPSLLPAFKGLRTHQAALDAGVSKHGASVHFVTPELDDGPVIMQAQVAVQPNDNAPELAARVLVAEHHLYPAAMNALMRGEITWTPGHPPIYQGQSLQSPLLLDSIASC